LVSRHRAAAICARTGRDEQRGQAFACDAAGFALRVESLDGDELEAFIE
jgi:hypothetical protein